jgi:hypothetical protein
MTTHSDGPAGVHTVAAVHVCPRRRPTPLSRVPAGERKEDVNDVDLEVTRVTRIENRAGLHLHVVGRCAVHAARVWVSVYPRGEADLFVTRQATVLSPGIFGTLMAVSEHPGDWFAVANDDSEQHFSISPMFRFHI